MVKELQYFEQIHDVMIRSGQLVMQRFGTDFEIFEKDGGSIVTSVDFENEQFLKLELAKIAPQASFFAEESGRSGQKSDFVWVIDAVDGTRNFIKGIPLFCIMIALTYKDEPVMSAIYQPVTKQLYYAEKGKGVWLQGKQIRFVDTLIQTKTGIVTCAQDDYPQIKLKFKEKNIQVSRRYFGSAGIDALFLVSGNIDFLIFRNANWWDVVPGMLMITEMEGLAYSYEKSSIKEYCGTFQAGNKLFF
ncbi:inositol monophosphatase [Candidatus Babeliales bacterium]|nr:inositol monophosphatase [Candidatus Babeliales bacterium]MBP9844332.1 inositol monophosphatase [Candidatus Babeliales bacterium]